MAAPRSRSLPTGARLGMWLAVGAWLIGFALVTTPDSIRFLEVMAGVIGLTLAAALSLDLLGRRAPRYYGGAICLAIAVIAAFWCVAVEPALQAEPDVVSRLRGLGASAHVSPFLPLGTAAVGVVLILTARRRRTW